jgi:hypothetical protein
MEEANEEVPDIVEKAGDASYELERDAALRLEGLL